LFFRRHVLRDRDDLEIPYAVTLVNGFDRRSGRRDHRRLQQFSAMGNAILAAVLLRWHRDNHIRGVVRTGPQPVARFGTLGLQQGPVQFLLRAVLSALLCGLGSVVRVGNLVG